MNPHGSVPAAVAAELPNDSSESSYRPPGNSSSPSSASQSDSETKTRNDDSLPVAAVVPSLVYHPCQNSSPFYCHLMRFSNMASFIYFMNLLVHARVRFYLTFPVRNVGVSNDGFIGLPVNSALCLT